MNYARVQKSSALQTSMPSGPLGFSAETFETEPVQINVVIGSASLPPSFPEQRHLLFSVLPSSGVLPI